MKKNIFLIGLAIVMVLLAIFTPYLPEVIYIGLGYIFGIGIRAILSRLRLGSSTCNLEKKGITGRALGAFAMAAASLYFSIPILFLFVGFVIYESGSRWCIVKSFQRKI